MAARAADKDLFTEEGKLIPWKQLVAAVGKDRAMDLSTAEADYERSPEQARTYAAQAREARTPVDKTDQMLGRIGATGRRLLGGFGLMYMRNIANIIEEPLKIGYTEGFQMKQTYQQAFAQQLGTPLTANPEEAQQRILATQYGGTGYAALRNAQNQVMRSNPALYTAGQTAVSAAGGFAAAEWLMGTIAPAFASSGAGLAVAGITAGVAAVGITALNQYGAYSDQDKTAIANATRMNNGENLAFYKGQEADNARS